MVVGTLPMCMRLGMATVLVVCAVDCSGLGYRNRLAQRDRSLMTYEYACSKGSTIRRCMRPITSCQVDADWCSERQPPGRQLHLFSLRLENMLTSHKRCCSSKSHEIVGNKTTTSQDLAAAVTCCALVALRAARFACIISANRGMHSAAALCRCK